MMKRIVALILTVIMIFALVACGKEKAEKYCWSCGEGITKSAVFCEHCGAKINESSNDTTTTTTTTNHSEEEETNTTKADETTTSVTKQKTTQNSTTTTTTTTTKRTTTTTTKKTTTTTTKTTTTAHKHSYYKYVCAGCGAVDKTHAYEYLIEWVKENGVKDGANIEYVFEGRNNSADCYGLTYSVNNDYLYVWHFDATTSYSSLTSLSLDIFYYGFSYGGDSIYGYIKPSTYTQNTALTYKSYDCSVLAPEKYLSVAQSGINVVLAHLDIFLEDSNLQIGIYDLGFKSFW